MLTVKVLSACLNIKQSTLYLWVSQGKIPCRRIYGLIRFEHDAIQAWLNGFSSASNHKPSGMPRHNATDVDPLLLPQKRVTILPDARNQTKTEPNKEVDDGTVSAEPGLVDGFFLLWQTGQKIH